MTGNNILSHFVVRLELAGGSEISFNTWCHREDVRVILQLVNIHSILRLAFCRARDNFISFLVL